MLLFVASSSVDSNVRLGCVRASIINAVLHFYI